MPRLEWCIRFVAQCIVGVVLLVAGAGKALDPMSFALNIHGYELLSLEAAAGIAIVVPWLEIIVGASILLSVASWTMFVAAAAMFAGFSMAIGSALWRGLEISCGCFGDDMPLTAMTLVRAVGLLLLASLGILLSSNMRDASRGGRRNALDSPQGLARARSGVTLLELLVVIGTIALLMAILLPALASAREKSRAIVCAAHLREIGLANASYANNNDGWIPRTWSHLLPPDLPEAPPDPPTWIRLLSEELDVGPEGIHEVFFCPSHAPPQREPGSYIVNAFDFLTRPRWQPAGPIRISRIKSPSDVIWVGEVPDWPPIELPGPIEHFRQMWEPRHLPGPMTARLTDVRHGRSSNYLFADGSVRAIQVGGLRLHMFDTGNTQEARPRILRITPPPAIRGSGREWSTPSIKSPTCCIKSLT